DLLRKDCYNGVATRSLMKFEVHVVDLSDPANPERSPVLTFGEHEEGVSMLTRGDTLYVTVKQPVDVLGDPRPHVRYFVRPIDLSEPSRPVIRPAINVPGELLAVRGNTIYTRDMAWGSEFIEFAVARLRLDDNVARLEKYHQLPYDYLTH